MNSMLPAAFAQAAERFWSKVPDQPGMDCWEWTGSRNKKGYGTLHIGSRTDGSKRVITAHRFSYRICCGEMPEGLFVCHACDNPSCVNPGHLYLGTNLDNIRDCITKGRRRYLQGKDNHNTRISLTDVAAIHAARAAGAEQREIARLYGVSQTTIWRVLHGHTRGSAL